MNILLLYFTGTYNTRFVTNKLRESFEKEGCSVTTYEIDPMNEEILDFSPYDIVGLGHPIYGFAAPWPFLRFIRKQKFPEGKRVFIYKNSGESYHENDASSKYVLKKLRKDKVRIENEYHFCMPYNIHFRYDDYLIKEMFEKDEKLMRILVHEVLNGIPNLKPYKLWPKVVTTVVAPFQYIAGDINSFLYKVDMKKCIGCGLCIKNCPKKNIYKDEKGNIKFHHDCQMCMRCSFYCPVDAFDIGFLDDWGWRVNGGYNFKKIEGLEVKEPIITKDTEGFFECFKEKFDNIDKRYNELFGK